MTKNEKIKKFDPNSVANASTGMYGLPFTVDECEIVLIPVPWEVTVSYGGGTADGPQAIFNASYQVDLFDPFVKDAWKAGIGLDEINEEIKIKSDNMRRIASRHIAALSEGADPTDEERLRDVELIREESLWLNKTVYERALHLIGQNKYVALVGGDHSTPLGLMRAMADTHGSFGILQIDAHADLRNSYEGLEFSHASISYNALKIKQVEKLVQVGIRDYCEEEIKVINNSGGRVKTFFDRDIKYRQFRGETWDTITQNIISELPEKVYLTFDIDGLDPKLCPNTGTPVAGGFETEQVLYLLEKLVETGKKIIGFDLNEVSAGNSGSEWDANVAARLLYRICNLAKRSIQ